MEWITKRNPAILKNAVLLSTKSSSVPMENESQKVGNVMEIMIVETTTTKMPILVRHTFKQVRRKHSEKHIPVIGWAVGAYLPVDWLSVSRLPRVEWIYG